MVCLAAVVLAHVGLAAACWWWRLLVNAVATKAEVLGHGPQRQHRPHVLAGQQLHKLGRRPRNRPTGEHDMLQPVGQGINTQSILADGPVLLTLVIIDLAPRPAVTKEVSTMPLRMH